MVTVTTAIMNLEMVLRMTRFTVPANDIKKFIKNVLCGVQTIVESTAKPTKYFFNYFFITPEKDKISVIACDSVLRRVLQKSSLKVKMERVGTRIPVYYPKELIDSISLLRGDITFDWSDENNTLSLSDENSTITIEMPAGESVDKSLVHGSDLQVDEWANMHSWETLDDETIVPKITVGDQSATYDHCYLGLPAEELARFASMVTKIVSGSSVKVSFLKDGISLNASRADTRKTASVVIKPTSVRITREFDSKQYEVIGMLQILSNLPGTQVDLFLRVNSQGDIILWISTVDEKTEYNFSLDVS